MRLPADAPLWPNTTKQSQVRTGVPALYSEFINREIVHTCVKCRCTENTSLEYYKVEYLKDALWCYGTRLILRFFLDWIGFRLFCSFLIIGAVFAHSTSYIWPEFHRLA